MSMPVIQMMPGVELQPFTPRPRSDFGLGDDCFIFLFMFDMASIMERKNPLALIAAFAQAFRGNKKVQLVLKTSRGDSDPALIHQLHVAGTTIGARVIDKMMSREDSYALMQASDCYVSLHRSEGFGLTMAEAMLMGKPVIATGYSGNLDFMDSHNSLLVDCKVVRLQRDVPPYKLRLSLGGAVGRACSAAPTLGVRAPGGRAGARQSGTEGHHEAAVARGGRSAPGSAGWRFARHG